jgi:YfiH family protein
MINGFAPDWSAPAGVRAWVTTRGGGASRAPWDSFNLADHVGDDAAAVTVNRGLLRRDLPSEPVWLRQVHGVRCVDAEQAGGVPEADASFSRGSGHVCTVLTADCLPVLLCNRQATVVAAAHAGWRGLAAGVLESTVEKMTESGANLMAWLGPAIGPQAFEVGADVRDMFLAQDAAASAAFVQTAADRWHCDLYRLAQRRLEACGISRITVSPHCTVRDRDLFFSYRRDGVTGRMASCIWLE